MSVKNAKH